MKEKKNGRPNRVRLFQGACAFAIAAAVFVVMQFAAPQLFAITYANMAASAASSTAAVSAPAVPPTLHVPTPNPLRAIYMSQCVVGTPSFRESLVKFIENSDLNAVVIDVKDYSGGIAFPSTDPLLEPFVSKTCGAHDMQAFIKELHEKHIYVIARITTFQDPMYTKMYPNLAVQKVGGGVWTDNHGLAFVDVGAKPFWNYIVVLGKAAYNLGFDELNFDYIRFPSDGPMAEALYPFDVGTSKAQALESFFKYLNEQLKPTGAVLSADLFGMTTTNTDDLNIGQVLERAMPYFDYIDPMVYPSHYPTGFNGYKDVNDHPYDIVHFSLARAVERAEAATTSVPAMAETPIMKEVVVPATASEATSTKEVATGIYEKQVYPASKIRPWLQSFDYPVPYLPAMVQAQIQATNDVGLHSWLVWDAANKYTSLRSLLTETAAASQ